MNILHSEPTSFSKIAFVCGLFNIHVLDVAKTHTHNKKKTKKKKKKKKTKTKKNKKKKKTKKKFTVYILLKCEPSCNEKDWICHEKY